MISVFIYFDELLNLKTPFNKLKKIIRQFSISWLEACFPNQKLYFKAGLFALKEEWFIMEIPAEHSIESQPCRRHHSMGAQNSTCWECWLSFNKCVVGCKNMLAGRSTPGELLKSGWGGGRWLRFVIVRWGLQCSTVHWPFLQPVKAEYIMQKLQNSCKGA